MTIETLIYIYDLLNESVKVKEGAKIVAAKMAEKAEEDEASNAKTLKEVAEKARKEWFKAQDALADFEHKEWN